MSYLWATLAIACAFGAGMAFERLRWNMLMRKANEETYGHRDMPVCGECGVYYHKPEDHMRHCRQHPANKDAWRRS